MDCGCLKFLCYLSHVIIALSIPNFSITPWELVRHLTIFNFLFYGQTTCEVNVSGVLFFSFPLLLKKKV